MSAQSASTQSTETPPTTRELIALHDMAGTLANVLCGLTQMPRCTGPALIWAEATLEHLYETQNTTAAALLKCDDENRMRAVVLARHTEWAMEDDDSAVLLKVCSDVTARVKGLLA